MQILTCLAYHNCYIQNSGRLGSKTTFSGRALNFYSQQLQSQRVKLTNLEDNSKVGYLNTEEIPQKNTSTTASVDHMCETRYEFDFENVNVIGQQKNPKILYFKK